MIFFGDIQSLIAQHIGDRPVVLVSDKKVAKLYLTAKHNRFINERGRVIFVNAEKSKSISGFKKVVKKLVSLGANKDYTLVAFGGGAVSDLAGYVAGAYMRGMPLVNIPTTILGAVDASIGGKTALNFKGKFKTKNILGTYYAADKTLVDKAFFDTLALSQKTSGMGEIVKHALLDEQLFNNIRSESVENLVMQAISVKQRIVREEAQVAGSQRGQETSIRKQLNAGHTVGHALEAYYKFKIPHGVCVLSGILIEAHLADKLGIIEKDYYGEIVALIKSFRLKQRPIKPRQIEKLFKNIMLDKKNKGGKICFILPTQLGQVREVYLEQGETFRLLREIIVQ
ncbi:MAG: 3-dehydroquinate synthase [Firmicutes bacterium]|nr:3-dehydroquinate synthase [Bacillota bacterium]